MSDSDSFINEVTDEVRRDRLFALVRRWAWLAVLVVVGIVGAAAYFEWSRSQAERTAQDFGDAVFAALERPNVADRVDALSDITADTPEAAILLAMLQSGELARDGDSLEAARRLRAAAAAPELDPRYRDLATLRAEMLDPSAPAEARLILETLAAPGAPYAPLAQEQLALLALREGEANQAVEMLRRIADGAATPPGLQDRAAQLIVAIEAGSVLVDDAAAPASDADAPGMGPDTGADAATETDTQTETGTGDAPPATEN